MLKVVRNLLRSRKGATPIEYGLIAALMSVAAITAWQTLGTGIAQVSGQ